MGGAGFARGKVSDGFTFDGANDYGDAGATENLAQRYFVLAAWVQTTAVGSQTIAERGVGGDPTRRNFYFGITSGHVRFAVGDGTVDHVVSGTSAVNDGEFHFVAAAMFPDDSMQVFVDGALEGEATFPGIEPFTTPPQSMIIGASDGSALSGVQVTEPFRVVDELVMEFGLFGRTDIRRVFEAGEAGICKFLPGQRTGFTINFDDGEVLGLSYSEAEIRVSRLDMTPLNFESSGGSFELVNRGGETAIQFDHAGNPFTAIRIDFRHGYGQRRCFVHFFEGRMGIPRPDKLTILADSGLPPAATPHRFLVKHHLLPMADADESWNDVH